MAMEMDGDYDGSGADSALEVTSLYPTAGSSVPVEATPAQLAAWPVVVPADGVRGGGLVVFSVEAKKRS